MDVREGNKHVNKQNQGLIAIGAADLTLAESRPTPTGTHAPPRRRPQKMLQENQEILEGRFKIIKKLGSGAFGEIFKGKSLTATFLDAAEVYAPEDTLLHAQTLPS